MPIDFDTFLADPGDTMRAICAHFALTVPQEFLDGISRNPILTRYSKAPEHAYTPDLRKQILSASRALNAAEIRKGMLWIEAFTRNNPDHADSLST